MKNRQRHLDWRRGREKERNKKKKEKKKEDTMKIPKAQTVTPQAHHTYKHARYHETIMQIETMAQDTPIGIKIKRYYNKMKVKKQ
jgi:hypothetical protein